MCQKNVLKVKDIKLLLIEEEGIRHYVPIKDFNTSVYDHTLYHGRNIFYHCCLQALSSKEMLKQLNKCYFKINGKHD